MRGNLGLNSTPDKFPNEADIVANMKQPLAIFHGEGDQAIKGDYFDELEITLLTG